MIQFLEARREKWRRQVRIECVRHQYFFLNLLLPGVDMVLKCAPCAT